MLLNLKLTYDYLHNMHVSRIYLPLLIGCLLGAASPSSAQDTTQRWRRPNVIKTNLLAPVSLFYERALTRRFALRFSARALKLPAGTFNEQEFINATLEGKIYTARPARLAEKPHPAGFFLNPYLKVRSLRELDYVGLNPDVFEEETTKSIGAGLTIGYQWVSRRGVVVEMFNGFGFMPPALGRYRRLESDGTVTTRLTSDYLKMDWRAGFGLGYAF